MGKATVNMTNWVVYVYEGKYNLSGVADRHPSLGKNVYVRYTSDLEKSEITDNILTYETQNTIYVCPLKYMSPHPYRNVVETYKEKLSHLGDNTENELDKLIASTACIALGKADTNQLAQEIIALQEVGQKELMQKEEIENRRLLDIVKQYENSVYIEVSNIQEGDKLAYHLGDAVGIVIPDINVGMFQDSILYMQYAEEENNYCSLDFRYFPKGWGSEMETYSWSDNIMQAVIKNDCEHSICFNHSILEPGETKVFTPKNHRQGLISPDCHNGKSMLFPGVSDEAGDE